MVGVLERLNVSSLETVSKCTVPCEEVGQKVGEGEGNRFGLENTNKHKEKKIDHSPLSQILQRSERMYVSRSHLKLLQTVHPNSAMYEDKQSRGKHGIIPGRFESVPLVENKTDLHFCSRMAAVKTAKELLPLPPNRLVHLDAC